MIRLLIRLVFFLGAAAVGLAVAALVIDGLNIDPISFIAVVVVFAVIQSVLSPFIAKVANNNAPALIGAAGLVSTFVGLFVSSLVFGDGFQITGGVGTWIIASVVVWLVTMVATVLLPVIFVKRKVAEARSGDGRADRGEKAK
ncbi:hypothetical protein EXU48_18205 [Occultella glacieicola]|uniref:Superfamily IV 4 TMS phage holin n=1 Tax=Occultella glacieicola TaxID=2518684 RepID=A0ABY2E062_9MICO|nr:hypothetical protein [Occultella glacieicola]TDE90387.1 hypothetical protein EXU48_18205 [Occultella glacieicola]